MGRPRPHPPTQAVGAKAVALAWTLTFLIVGGGLLWVLWPIFSVLFISAVFAYLLDPFVDRLEARGWSRKRGIGFIFGCVAVGLGLFVAILLPAVAGQFAKLIRNIPDYADNLALVLGPASTFIEEQTGQAVPLDFATLKAELPGWLGQLSPDARSGISAFLGDLFQSSMSFFRAILSLALLPIFTFYLLDEWDRLVRFFHDLVPQRHLPRVERMARAVDQRLNAFVRGQITVCCILGVMYTTGLWLSGIDLAVAIGLISGALFIIPYLGTIVGVMMASTLCLMKYGVDIHLVYVGLTFGISQGVESWFLTPRIVGEKVGLHALVVMLALLVGASLGGIWGMLLAIPVTATLNVMGAEWLSAYRQSHAFQGERR